MQRTFLIPTLVAMRVLPVRILAAAPASASVASLLQSFVDKHELAGAVALVVDKEKVRSVGHGGAHATNMEIRPAKDVALVWMVQHGGFPGDGGKAQGVFRNWAFERFGK